MVTGVASFHLCVDGCCYITSFMETLALFVCLLSLKLPNKKSRCFDGA